MAGIFVSYWVGEGFCASGSAFLLLLALMRSFSACLRAFTCLPRRRQIDHMIVTAMKTTTAATAEMAVQACVG